jgi:hypothetical protein
MVMGYIDKDGNYYEGDRQGVDIEVPKRPSENHEWIDGEWAINSEKIAKSLELALDAHIDSVAQSYRYDSIRTMVTYATSENAKFGSEGRAAVKFRDACYVKAIQIQEDVQLGQRDSPTEAELIAEMPLFETFLTV